VLITVKRSGGYAGIEEAPVSVDTSALDPGLRDEVERAVSEASFFDQPDEVPGEPGMDMFRYEVTIEDAGRSHTVAFGDPGDLSSPLGAIVRVAGGSG
jgi:hypothetical protein